VLQVLDTPIKQKGVAISLRRQRSSEGIRRGPHSTLFGGGVVTPAPHRGALDVGEISVHLDVDLPASPAVLLYLQAP
jgi:hypothetical protein